MIPIEHLSIVCLAFATICEAVVLIRCLRTERDKTDHSELEQLRASVERMNYVNSEQADEIASAKNAYEEQKQRADLNEFAVLKETKRRMDAETSALQLSADLEAAIGMVCTKCKTMTLYGECKNVCPHIGKWKTHIAEAEKYRPKEA